MSPHRPGAATRAALALGMAFAFGLGFLSPAGVAGQPGAQAFVWQNLPEGAPLAGHILLRLPSGSLLALGGESSPGQTGPQPRALDLSQTQPAWVDLAESGDIPRSRLTDRGLLGAAAIVDPAENLLLLTCDCADGRSTYTLDLDSGVWRAMASPESPGPLWYPLLAYDANRDRAVLIGGDLAGTGELSSAVWAFDLSPARAGWTRLGDAGWSVPLLFSASAMAADGALYVFSGGDALGSVTEQLWRVDLARAGDASGWSAVAVPAGPAGRLGASLVFDPATGTGWLYGGYRAVADIPQDQADVWRLTVARDSEPFAWDRLTTFVGPERPQARSGHAAAWDPAGERMVVYGGAHSAEGQTSYLGDAWSLALAAAPETATPSATPTAEPRIYLPWGSKP